MEILGMVVCIASVAWALKAPSIPASRPPVDLKPLKKAS
jgi:hypothetical protein